MEIALMSLGDIMDDPVTGRRFSATERYRMTLEAAEVADRSGIQGYYIGEHHGINYTFSSPAGGAGARSPSGPPGCAWARRSRSPPISIRCAWSRTMRPST